MRTARALFTEHPASVGENYLEHFLAAGGFGLRMLAGGCACMLHGLLPFLFVNTGSRTVADLYERMLTHRRRSAPL
jgi:hypothetical protein